MKIFGQLENATLEQLSSDPSQNTQGRIYQNTTEGRTKLDDGVSKKALLRNDDKIIIGNDSTPSNNVKIHKGTAGLLQDVPGDDATAEGSNATAIAQRSTRAENLIAASLPAPGNAGRHIFVTDQKVLAEDDGANWRRVIPEFSVDDASSGTSIQILPITSSTVRLTGSFNTIQMIPAGFAGQKVTLVNRTGVDLSVAHDSGATSANRIYTGTNANLVFKVNSSLQLSYDGVSQKWQVIGEASGAASIGASNSAFSIHTTDYTVSITDSILYADTSNNPINFTLPSAAGNIGKRFTFEKIGSWQNNILTIIGDVKGPRGTVTNPEIWALGAPLEIVSDGSNWNTVSPANGTVRLVSDPGSFIAVATASTANVSLESIIPNSTIIDNTKMAPGSIFVLKNQTVLEENGVYVMPTAQISIAATSTGNVDISTLANGSVVNAHVCSTGEKVSLRSQTNAQENGIYVIGAIPSATARDASMRHSSYLTYSSLRGLRFFCDWSSHQISGPPLAISMGTHVNDFKFFAQLNDNLTSFAAATWSSVSYAGYSFTVKPPPNAIGAMLTICSFGGGGGGGRGGVGGGGGGQGCLPISITYPKMYPNDQFSFLIPLGAPGGSAAQPGGQASITMTNYVNNSLNAESFPGGLGASSAAATVPGSGPSAAGTAYSSGGAAGASGGSSYIAGSGGSNGVSSGGMLGGGGGGAGFGFGGHGGSSTTVANMVAGSGDSAYIAGYGGGGGGGGAALGVGSRVGSGGQGGPAFISLTWI